MTQRMIHKYLVKDFRETHRMPIGSVFLSVSVDPQLNIALYLAVDPEEKAQETRTFWVVYTGRTVPDDSMFLGTIQSDDLMLHVFELFNRHKPKNIIREKMR